jgi:hypothetical protein
MKINELKVSEENPRIIKDRKFKKLIQSIKDFPEMLELRPIVIDENNIILGGNMRYRACIEAGLKDVPVKIAKGLSDKQKKEFTIKDNANFGEWDWDILGNEWNTYNLDDWGVDVWQNIDDQKEWIGMPEFEIKEESFQIKIHFETEKDRGDFEKEYKIKYRKKGTRTWSTWWPYKEQEDTKNLKYES